MKSGQILLGSFDSNFSPKGGHVSTSTGSWKLKNQVRRSTGVSVNSTDEAGIDINDALEQRLLQGRNPTQMTKPRTTFSKIERFVYNLAVDF